MKAMALAGKTAMEAYNLLKEAFREKDLSRSKVLLYHKEFKEERQSIENLSGHHAKESKRTTENIAAVLNMVKENRRLIVDEIAAALGLSHGTVHLILTKDLGLVKKISGWLPRLLSAEQKKQKMKMAKAFIKAEFQQSKAFLKSIVAMNES